MAATKGVLRHLPPLGDLPRRTLADSSARVPKVLSHSVCERDF